MKDKIYTIEFIVSFEKYADKCKKLYIYIVSKSLNVGAPNAGAH